MYFEIDRGTEGVRELASNANRYVAVGKGSRVGFIFECEQDMEIARSTMTHSFISYSVLDSFTTLNDEVLFREGTSDFGDEAPGPFFYG